MGRILGRRKNLCKGPEAEVTAREEVRKGLCNRARGRAGGLGSAEGGQRQILH